jgi:hypothetical protein
MKILRHFSLFLTLSLSLHPTIFARAGDFAHTRHTGIPELAQIATNASTLAARTTVTAGKTDGLKLEGTSVSVPTNVVIQRAAILLNNTYYDKINDCIHIPTHALRFSTSTNNVTVYFGEGCSDYIDVASDTNGSTQHFAQYVPSGTELCQITDKIFAQVDVINSQQPKQRSPMKVRESSSEF